MNIHTSDYSGLGLTQLQERLRATAQQLAQHQVYDKLSSLESLRLFMSFHVYAVWDFMSLLKSLQREITCVELPWRPSKYSKKMVRLINEIVLGEESDLGPDGAPIDHFSLYLMAMEEVGLDTGLVLERIQSLNFKGLPPAVVEFVSYNLELARSGGAHQVCAAFFFGREKIIPDLFRPALASIEQSLNDQQALKYYLARHIELDGDEHGPLAESCLMEIVGQDQSILREAYLTGLTSLNLRQKLWDAAAAAIDIHQTPRL